MTSVAKTPKCHSTAGSATRADVFKKIRQTRDLREQLYEDVASGKVSLQQLLAVTQQNPANQLANPTSQPDMIAGSLTSNSLTFNWLADTKLLPLLDSSRDITKIAARRLLLELGWSASIKLGEISSKNAKLLTQNPALQNPAPKKSSKT